MDRRCYEELLDERKNMELTYEERIAQLQDQHAEVSNNFFSLPLLTTDISLSPCFSSPTSSGLVWHKL